MEGSKDRRNTRQPIAGDILGSATGYVKDYRCLPVSSRVSKHGAKDWYFLRASHADMLETGLIMLEPDISKGLTAADIVKHERNKQPIFAA
ncbi:uncharacterized protein RAG0_09043 [Rhynchosporium agropyri]|uniref:Uncharacterized protein n=1 Tax=Rhynchosporium agropyri TaxID=914238 RepID=A0A1E1KTI3_9HELO|nr:uncharacterized protein RAG0_09043 [Rhynchosporium agropyri]